MYQPHKLQHVFKHLMIATAFALCTSMHMPAMADHNNNHPTSDSYRTAGEVKKVDAQTGRITLKHDDIKNLDMPGMTMIFQATDKTMLNELKPGDHVEFRAEKEGSKFVVTDIKRMK